MFLAPTSVVTAALAAALLAPLAGCAGGGGSAGAAIGAPQASAAPATAPEPEPSFARMFTPLGIEVRTPVAQNNSAQLGPAMAEIDAALTGFEYVFDGKVDIAYVSIDQALGEAPAAFAGDGVIVAGLRDTPGPHLVGFPDALGELARAATADADLAKT